MLITAGMTVIALLCAAPAAHAAFGFQGLSGAPTDLHAGGHSDIQIHVGFSDPNQDVKNLTIHLPPGVVGNPTVTPFGTPAQLDADNCPAASAVGTVSSDVTITVIAIPVPLTVNGTLYNLVPHGGPARFGIVLRPVSAPPLPSVLPRRVLQSGAQLRPTDFGLDTVINNIPNTSSGLPTHINSMDVTLDGMVGGQGFMRNPTSCTTKTFGFDATAYSGQQANGSAPSFTPTNCNALDFSPTLSASIGTTGLTAPGSRTPVTTAIDQDASEAGLENATVLLPSSDEITPDTLILSHTCAPAQFHADASACPASSVVGLATATSPLLATGLSGPVVLVQAVGLPKLGISLQGPLSLALLGDFLLTPSAGNSFQGLPDIPISHFELRFHGGPGGLILAGGGLCDPPPPTFHTDFDGWNGANQVGNPTATVQGCGGGGGGGGGGGVRKPKASVRLKKAHSKRPRMRLAVRAGSAPVLSAKLRLPSSLRFAGGKRFRRGVTAFADGRALPKSALHRHRSSLKVFAPVQGAKRLKVRARHGALRRVKRIRAASRLHFKLAVRDVDGRSTTLRVSPHAAR